MRIITGKFRGKLLFSPPKNALLRPTSDRVRESIFNTIRDKIKDSIFLDLFAGSGAVGFEALSEGAKFVMFIDKGSLSIQTLKKNVSLLDAERNISIMKRDVLSAVKNYRRIEERIPGKFNIAFLDPPYASLLAEKVTKTLAYFPLLHENSMIIAEHSSAELLPAEIQGENLLKKFKEKKYGEAVVTYYKLEVHNFQG